MHDLEFDENPMALDNLAYLMTDLHDDRLVELITHILQSPSRLRSAVNPKHLYDEAVSQLARNLELDGYATRPEGNHYALVAREPVIAGAASVEDDLTETLGRSGLPETNQVLGSLRRSADDFVRQPPDFNGCLTNARVALQAIGTSIAKLRAAATPPPFDETRWGAVLDYLRTSGFITRKEEEGLAGVFSFISPGAHTYVGNEKEEMTRLGRSLALSMCYFLVKKHVG